MRLSSLLMRTRNAPPFAHPVCAAFAYRRVSRTLRCDSRWPGSERAARLLPANPGLAGGGPAAYREDRTVFVETHRTPLFSATTCVQSRNAIHCRLLLVIE